MTVEIVKYTKNSWGYVVEFIARDATALARGNGYASNEGDNALIRNAIAHAHTSANLAYNQGQTIAKWDGNLKEFIPGGDNPLDVYKDQFNNEVGRRIADYVHKNNLPESSIDAMVISALKNDDLIVRLDDPRIENLQTPTWASPVTNWENADNGVRDYTGLPDPVSDFIIYPLVSNVIQGLLPAWLGGGVGMQAGFGSVGSATGSGFSMEPLILDLNGDGAHSTKLGWGVTGSKTYFDIDNDGYAERTAWVSPSDGLLAFDRNGNGVIDNQTELFGNTAIYADGFANLRQFDSNKDNKITTADAQFNNLRVWVDANSNGKTDARELKTLSSMAISQINLNATALSNTFDNENEVSAKSTFVIGNKLREIADHWFRIDQTDTRGAANVALNVETLFLPTLKGFGTLPDLHVAMSQDATLLGMVKTLATSTSLLSLMNMETIDNTVRSILFRWAGVDGISPTDTTRGLNTQINIFMEKMTGYQNSFLLTLRDGENVSGNAFDSQNLAFYNILNPLKSRLLAQVIGSQLFDNSGYNLTTGDFNQTPTISAAGFKKISDDLSRMTYWFDKTQYLNGITNFLVHTKPIESFSAYEVSTLESLWTAHYYPICQPWKGFAESQYYQSAWSFSGGEFSDFLMGNKRSTNYISGNGGDDYITGGDSADYLYGGDGNDLISSGTGHDRIEGGLGNDTIDGGLGNDVLNGGDGNDTYIYGGGMDIIYEGGGVDKVILDKNIESVSFARIGERTLNIFIQGKASIVLENQFSESFGEADQIEKIVLLNGTEFDIREFKNVNGTEGDDSLVGFDHRYLKDDVIYAGSGNDTLKGGQGNDYLAGRDGIDTAIFSGLFADYTISGADTLIVQDKVGGDGTDTLTNIEKLIFSNGTYENGIFTPFQINRSPVLGKDSATVDEDKSVAINVLANDTDPDGNSLTIASVGKATNGVVIINANNTITYTPNADYNGSDSFLYTVSDGKGGTATQRVNITINPIDDVIVTNQNPVLGKDAATVGEDKSVVVNVLANDTDPDGNSLTIASVGKATNGSVIINANNTVTYTPNADYNGSDSFLYTVSDGKGGTATQRANITVTPVKDADIEGTNLGETLNGTANSESLAGLGGADTIYAGAGNDTLYGGYGADSLYGQGGADIFVFERGSAFDAVDTVKDFKLSDADKIDIKDLLIGYDSVTSAIINFVEITTSGANSIVKVDRDGAGATYTWQQIATIENVTGLTDEAAWRTSGNLIVA